MKTAEITWEDGQISYESFNNEAQLYAYMSAMERDGHQAVELYFDGVPIIKAKTKI